MSALRRVLAAAAAGSLLSAGLLLAPAATAAPAAAAAAADGIVAVEPAQGKADEGNIRLVTNRTCPSEATHFVVQIIGANFPTGSNAVGNSEIAAMPLTPDRAGMVVRLFGSWEAIADANGAPTKLDGLARLKLMCIDADSFKSFGVIEGEIRFAKSASGASTFKQAAGKTLSSGIARTQADVPAETPYVYREDLPPGSPGGPPAPGNSTVNAAPFSTGADGDADAEGGTAEAAPAPNRGVLDDTTTAASGRSAGPSSLPLLLGAALLVAAGLGGYLVYGRLRRDSRSYL